MTVYTNKVYIVVYIRALWGGAVLLNVRRLACPLVDGSLTTLEDLSLDVIGSVVDQPTRPSTLELRGVMFCIVG
jgi:hypothetical protein